MFQRKSKRIKNLMGLHPKVDDLELSQKITGTHNLSVSVVNESDDVVRGKGLTDITNRFLGSSRFSPSLKPGGIFLISCVTGLLFAGKYFRCFILMLALFCFS